MTLTLEQAEALAERTLAAIDQQGTRIVLASQDADRERIESDLAGLLCHPWDGFECTRCDSTLCTDVPRYSDGLLRTARLYGVEV